MGRGLTLPQSRTLDVEIMATAYIARVDVEAHEVMWVLNIPGQQRVDALAANLVSAFRTPEAADLLALGAAEGAGQDFEGRNPNAVAIKERLSPGGKTNSPEAGAPLGEPGEGPRSASAESATGDPVLEL